MNVSIGRAFHTKEGQLSVSSRVVVLELECSSESPGGCVRMQTAGSQSLSFWEGLGSS